MRDGLGGLVHVAEQRIDGIPCDLNLRGMSGDEFAATHPSADRDRVALMTGGAYAPGDETAHLGRRVWNKPSTQQELHAAVEAAYLEAA